MQGALHFTVITQQYEQKCTDVKGSHTMMMHDATDFFLQ